MPPIFFNFSIFNLALILLEIYLLVGIARLIPFIMKGYGISLAHNHRRRILVLREDLIEPKKSSPHYKLQLILVCLSWFAIFIVFLSPLITRKTYDLPGKVYLNLSNKNYKVSTCRKQNRLLVSLKTVNACKLDSIYLENYLLIEYTKLESKDLTAKNITELLNLWQEEETAKNLPIPSTPGVPQIISDSKFTNSPNLIEVTHNHSTFGNGISNQYTFYALSQPYLYSITFKSLPEFFTSFKKILSEINFPSIKDQPAIPTPNKQVSSQLFNSTSSIVGSWAKTELTRPSQPGLSKLDHFEIFRSGYFEHQIGSDICVVVYDQDTEGKELGYQGTWEFENNTLVLTPQTHTVLKSGARAIAGVDCGTKEQRINAVIEKSELPKEERIVFTRGWCNEPGFVIGCEMYTDKGERYNRTEIYPSMMEILTLETKLPLIFGKYKIIPPKGWGWMEKIEGTIAEIPGRHCRSDYMENESMEGKKKCSYINIMDLSENCPFCPRIEIADFSGKTMGGGGYIPTVEEFELLGKGKYATRYHISWEGASSEKPTEKIIDIDGKPSLYYVEGCPRNDLCIYFNSWAEDWEYEKIKDFINGLVISETEN